MYTSLHNHTDYSNLRLIDSINTVPKLINRAFELGLKGVAITDHESVSGHVKAINHFNSMKDKGDFKLILGNEIYITRSSLNAETHQKGENFYHFLLLAKNKQGHKQLRKLSSRAWGRSYMKNLIRVPTFIEDLEEIIGSNPGNIIGTTACLGGYPGTMFQMGEYEQIEKFLESMLAIFGKNHFFIEIQPSNHRDQIEFNKYMIDNYWNDYDFIFTTDSHYLAEEEKEVHKWFLQSKSGEREVDSFYSSAYLMNYDEVKSFFSYIDEIKLETMRQNTNNICDMVEIYNLDHPQIVPKIKYEDRFDKEVIEIIVNLFEEKGLESYHYLNKFIKSPETEADKYLINLILTGYYNKIYSLETTVKDVAEKDRMERINYELEQIYETSVKIEQSLSDYFITMSKMIDVIWNDADSIVGPGRGSASGFLINYLVGITQLDPMTQELYLPPWRFIHKDRPGLPDIDIDTESNKRTKIFNKIKEYFNSINSDIVNVCTFGTEGSKSSIRTAARSLGIDDSVVAYLNSMIPNERGFDLSLEQCYSGDATHKPIKSFVEEMDKYPKLKKLAFTIEGLITRLGVHAAGILIFDSDPSDYNSVMKTSKGAVVSAYNLDDSEKMGGLKYDMLTVAALDKIHTTLNLLMEYGEINWEGTLQKTYDKHLLPAILEYDDIEMWKRLWRGEITDVFQFDTMVGSQAIRSIRPEKISELAVANSIMRLMAQQNMELPLDVYVKYKRNIELWYNEMQMYGLSDSEIKVLEKHLKVLYGIADSQESVMQLVMDKKIAGFTLNEANFLRKAIAKKDAKVLEQTKELFYKRGKELKTSEFLLNYVWQIQIGRQIGYSFSILHTMAYSAIAVQQMNLVHKFPSIYWQTACLSVNAGAVNEEDYYNLILENAIEIPDDQDVKTNKKNQYGKVASAIGDMRGTIEVRQPDINKSKMGFTPDATKNVILYGLKGITKLGDKVILEIILNRPYESLNDFLSKMLTTEGKKVVSKDRVVYLIKAGAFDEIENKPREHILYDFIKSIADQKNNLNLNNFKMLMRNNLVPDFLDEQKRCYNFTGYVRKSRHEEYYLLDEISEDYIIENFPEDRIKNITIGNVEYKAISSSWWDSVYNGFMDKVRKWIKDNMKELLEKLNEALFKLEYDKYAQGNILDWELEALNFFYSGHPLDNVKIPLEYVKYSDMREGDIVGQFMIKGKSYPKYRTQTIVGTVIDKNNVTGVVTLATKEDVVDVKCFKQLYSFYSHESKDENGEIVDENFFIKGTHLAVTGIKRGDMFIPKVYKGSKLKEFVKIVIEDGEFKTFRIKS